MPHRYYLISGEASGDLHGGRLINAIKERDPQAVFRAWGGENMEQAGAEIVTHYREMAFMGFIEVIRNIRFILGLMKKAKKDLLEFKPDVLVLIDYPGFNMRMAEFAKKNNIKVVYYIAPQVWAWKAHRVEKLKKTVDALLCILPFEKDFFKNRGMDVEFVGHPLLDHVEWLENLPAEENKQIALIPGSRKQEISNILPIMLATAAQMPDFQFNIAAAPSQNTALYQTLIGDLTNVHIRKDGVKSILQNSNAALVTSGTATLETALVGIPQIVCYHTSWSSYQLAKFFIKVPFISLVNLIANKEVVPEMIQNALSPEGLKKHLLALLHGEAGDEQRKSYIEIREKLGRGGASHRAADAILKLLNHDVGA